MISLTKLIIGLVIAIVLLVLVLSGKARTLLKAFFNLFVEDLAGQKALHKNQC